LIGVGVAIPICFLVFILVQLAGGGEDADAGPAARAEEDVRQPVPERPSPISLPGRYWFRPRVKPSSIAMLLLKYGNAELFFRVLVRFVIYFGVAVALGTGVFLLACKILGERLPDPGDAFRVVLAVLAIGTVLGMVAVEITGRDMTLALLPVHVAVGAFFFAGAVRVEFGRGLVISGLYFGILAAIAYLFSILSWTLRGL
jgi:hypothetical protein